MLYRPAPSRRTLSSRDGASPLQIGLALAILFLLTACLTTGALGVFGLTLLTAPLFLLLIAVHLGALIDALMEHSTSSRTPLQAPSVWPVYSILIALRHEARMASQLIGALDALEYPPDRLDVLLLVEADDVETADAFRVAVGSRGWRVETVPQGGPLTKPNALNHGLKIARGQLVTVFDAEDLPDPQQLRLAAMQFMTAPQNVMALQAHLEFDNERDGWLPKMMAIEYAALFELTKPGLAAAGYPVALGGTSNHFRTADLIAIGGWDAGNVTEDADLGLRIARAGGRIEDLASPTREEAPISFWAWFRQRRRWLKGWMQTAITHGREPRRAIREAGPLNYLVGMLQVGGVVLGVLLFPPFFMVTCLTMMEGAGFADTQMGLVLQAVAVVTFLLGATSVLLPAWLGLKRQGKQSLTPWLLTMPIYLVLISLAGWFAIADLIRRPFHWAKTEHGLGTRP